MRKTSLKPMLWIRLLHTQPGTTSLPVTGNAKLERLALFHNGPSANPSTNMRPWDLVLSLHIFSGRQMACP